mgnify:CR=1 FL=1
MASPFEAVVRTILRDMTDTRLLAATLASRLKAGDVLALAGDLGAGKTTLVKAIAAVWGAHEAEVRSPTFALIQVHELAAQTLVHADLYRLKDTDDLLGCGLLEHLGADDCVVAIEWPELAEPWLPEHTLRLQLRLLPDGSRQADLAD